MIVEMQPVLKPESNQLSERINVESGLSNMIDRFSWSDIEDMEEDEVIETMVLDGSLPGFHSTTYTSIHGIEQENDGQKSRVPNKKTYFIDEFNLFQQLYLNEGHVFDENDFERRLRMPRVLFERICERICDKLIGKRIFIQRRDETGKQRINPRMSIISSLRVLEYDLCLDQVDKICAISASSTRLNLINLIEAIANELGEEYIRSPIEDYLRRIIQINASKGLPGYIGSWDFQHW